MAYDIGPVIGIEGEKEFRNQINKINMNMKTLGTEMDVVTSQFDKNDKSAEALTAQNKVLNKQIDEQKSKLSELQKGLSASSEKYGENNKVTQGWRQSVNKATADLNKMERELNSNTKAINSFGNEAKESTVKTGRFSGALKGLGSGLASVGTVAGKTIITSIKAIGAAAVTAAAGIVALTESTKEYRSDLSKLEQNAKTAGNSFDVMKNELMQLASLTDETDSSIEALSNLMAIGFNDNQLKSAVDALSGAVIKFPDTLKIESLADGLQETLATGAATGPFAELIERMGGNLDDFNSKLEGATTKAGKQQVALDWLAKSGLAKVNEQYRQTNKDALAAAEAQFKLNDSMSKLAKVAEPSITSLKTGLTGILTSLIGVVTGSNGAATQFAENIKSFTSILLSQINTFIPILSTTLQALIPALIIGITEALPTLAQAALDILLVLVTEIIKALPQIVSVGLTIIISLINGITAALPSLLPLAVQAILTIVQGLLENLPQLVDAAIALVLGLIDGLIKALPLILEKAPQIIETLINGIIVAIPQLAEASVKIIIALVNFILNNIPLIGSTAGKIVVALVAGLIRAIPELIIGVITLIQTVREQFERFKWSEIGINIIQGIINGIKGSIGKIGDAAKEAAKTALEGAKNFLGIHSPSRVMRDQVGKMIGLGLAEGIQESTKAVSAAMDSLNNKIIADGSIDIDPRSNKPKRPGSSGGSTEPDNQVYTIIKVPVSVDGKVIAEAEAPYSDKIQGSNVALAGRGRGLK